MNRIFNVVFNETTGTYQAAPENAKTKKKSNNVLKQIAVCLAIGACMPAAIADDGMVIADGLSHTITQSAIRNDNGLAIDVRDGSVVFSDTTANVDIKGYQSDAFVPASKPPQFGAGLGVGGGAPFTASSATIEAKNISILGSSENATLNPIAYSIQTHGPNTDRSTITLKATENISLTSKVADSTAHAIAVNNSDGLGTIKVEAGNKITVFADSPHDNNNSHAVYVSSLVGLTEDSITSFKAKDIEITGDDGMDAFNKGSKIILEAQNSNIIHAVGTNSDSHAVLAQDGLGTPSANQASISITGGNNQIIADHGAAVVGSAGNVTLNARTGSNTVLASDGNAVYANKSSHIKIDAAQKNTIQATNYAVYANSNSDITINSKQAEISGKYGLVSFNGSKVNLNTADKINLNGQSYAAYASGVDSTIKINAANTSSGTVYGNIVATKGGLAELIGNALTVNSNIYIQAETNNSTVSADLKGGSIFTGMVSDASGALGTKGDAKLKLAENSTWRVSNNSFVTQLQSNDSTIDLAAMGGNYKSVTAGNFSGTDNTVRLRINLADEQVSTDPAVRKTDQLRILNATGDSNNKVNIIIEQDTTDDSKLHSNNWLVKADNVTGKVRMSDVVNTRAAADGSTKTWRLKFIKDPSTLASLTPETVDALSDTTSGEGGEWYLVRTAEETEETKTVEDFGSPYGEYYAWFADLSDLRHRLGEVRSGAREGGWAKASYSKYNADGIGNGRFDADDYSIHLGYDHIVSENDEGAWLVGGAFRGGHTDMNANHGASADVNHYSGKLYGTYIANNGNYADFVASLGYFDKKFEGTSNTGLRKATGDYTTWGAGLSAEVGKKMPFSERVREDGSVASWFFEPQAQLSYYWVKGKDFTTNTGMKVEQDDTDFLTGRLGFLLGHKMSESAKDPNKRYVQVALRGGLMHEFLGDAAIRVNGERHTGSIDGTAVYYGVDFDWNFADNQRLYVQLDRAHSSDYTKEVEVRVGYRYQF